MGNQQESLLSWFAGILDGEGSISVQVYTKPDGDVRLTPFVLVVNTDVGILEGCDEALKAIGVVPNSWRKPSSAWQKNATWSLPCMSVRADGAKKVRPILEAITPYLRSAKRRNAETILQYLDSRKERGLKRDKLGRINRVAYSRAEIELISSIRSHKRAKSSEAICLAPNVIG
jgi:hypothetical protein